jgi:hypothetical protein
MALSEERPRKRIDAIAVFLCRCAAIFKIQTRSYTVRNVSQSVLITLGSCWALQDLRFSRRWVWSKDLWNVGKLLPDYTMLQPRRQPSSCWALFCHLIGLYCSLLGRLLLTPYFFIFITFVRCCPLFKIDLFNFNILSLVYLSFILVPKTFLICCCF